jgi:hypothetical protein
MKVYQARAYEKPRRVNDRGQPGLFAARRRCSGKAASFIAESRYAAITNEEIGDCINARARVEQSSSSKQKARTSTSLGMILGV